MGLRTIGLRSKITKRIEEGSIPSDAEEQVAKLEEKKKKEKGDSLFKKLVKKKPKVEVATIEEEPEAEVDPSYEEEAEEPLTEEAEEGPEESPSTTEKPEVKGKEKTPSLQDYLMYEPNYRAELVMQLGRIATALEKLTEQEEGAP